MRSLQGNNDGRNVVEVEKLTDNWSHVTYTKGKAKARIPDKGNINVRILRSRSFETIRGGKINIGEGNVSANLRGGCTQTHDEFQTHLLKGEQGGGACLVSDERNLLRMQIYKNKEREWNISNLTYLAYIDGKTKWRRIQPSIRTEFRHRILYIMC